MVGLCRRYSVGAYDDDIFEILQQTNPSVATSPTAAAQKFAVLSDQFMKDSLALSPTSASEAGISRRITTPRPARPSSSTPIGRYELGIHRKTARILRRVARTIPRPKLRLRPWTRKTPPIGSSLTIRSVSICSNSTRFRVTGTIPTVVVELIGDALFLPLTQTYAPHDVRVGQRAVSRGPDSARLRSSEAVPDERGPCLGLSTAVEENRQH